MTTFHRDNITLIHGDCMDYLATLPDGAFSLAVVDPPYGIGVDGAIHIKKPDRPSTWSMVEKYDRKEWDKKPPPREYWENLFKVSKGEIVWGGNYFTDYLFPSKGWVFWDKMFENTFNFSHGELAWTSFDRQLLKITMSSKSETRGGQERVHPTQKPVALYRWLLQNYAKPGDTILDTHLGSGSSAIAAWEMGFTFVGIEIDKDYFDGAVARLEKRMLSPYLPGIVPPAAKQESLL